MNLNDRFSLSEDEVSEVYEGKFDLTETCSTCGAVVADLLRHHEWHLELEGRKP